MCLLARVLVSHTTALLRPSSMDDLASVMLGCAKHLVLGYVSFQLYAMLPAHAGHGNGCGQRSEEFLRQLCLSSIDRQLRSCQNIPVPPLRASCARAEGVENAVKNLPSNREAFDFPPYTPLSSATIATLSRLVQSMSFFTCILFLVVNFSDR